MGYFYTNSVLSELRKYKVLAVDYVSPFTGFPVSRWPSGSLRPIRPSGGFLQNMQQFQDCTEQTQQYTDFSGIPCTTVIAKAKEVCSLKNLQANPNYRGFWCN